MKKRMKKVVSMLLAGIMVLGMTACGSKNDSARGQIDTSTSFII